jgi:hypothetical protein
MVGYLIAFTIDRKSFYERMKDRLLSVLPEWNTLKEQPVDPHTGHYQDGPTGRNG